MAPVTLSGLTPCIALSKTTGCATAAAAVSAKRLRSSFIPSQSAVGVHYTDRTGRGLGLPTDSGGSQLGDRLDHRIAIAKSLLANLDAEPGSLGRRHIAGHRHRDIVPEVWIHIVVKMIHALQDVEVRQRRCGVNRGIPQDGAATGVRRSGN